MSSPLLRDDPRAASAAVLPYQASLRRGSLRDLRELMILLIIVATVAAMCVASPEFRTPSYLLSLLLSLSIESIVAIGMTMLMVAGGFDLSVGSNVAFSGAVAAICLQQGVPVPVAIAAALATGAGIGLLNGLIVAKIGINPFITTLGMLSIVRGVLLVITRGQNIYGLPESFKRIGQGELLGVQYPIYIAIAMVIVGDLLLRKSRFFRQNYYIGGNEKAAALSGIAVDSVKIFNYALVGFLCAVAGVVMTSRFGSATVNAAQGLELKVISAVVIGGASLQGGEGTVLGSFLGSLLMVIIVGSLTLLGVDMYWHTLVIGATLLLAVMIDTLGKRWGA